jgi:hypothetical protein
MIFKFSCLCEHLLKVRLLLNKFFNMCFVQVSNGVNPGKMEKQIDSTVVDFVIVFRYTPRRVPTSKVILSQIRTWCTKMMY